jgi:hypothetical protein
MGTHTGDYFGEIVLINDESEYINVDKVTFAIYLKDMLQKLKTIYITLMQTKKWYKIIQEEVQVYVNIQQ